MKGKVLIVSNALKSVLCEVFAVVLLVTMAGAAEGESYTAYAVVSSGSLNVRAHNWVGSEIIGRVENGWDVEVTSVTDNGWAYVHISCEAEYGYCKLEYLTTRPKGAGEWYNSTNGRVKIRKTMNGALAGWLKAGKKINVITWAKDNDGNDWAYTEKGWILGSCLDADWYTGENVKADE